MSKHLFFCDTPFQIMMAVAFKMTEFKDECVDIIVSDLIYNSNDLYENINKSNFFNRTYYINNYDYDYEKCNKIKWLYKKFHRIKDINALLPGLDTYDFFYTTDTLTTINSIYELLKKKNKNLQVIYYEEGPIAVLCDQGNHFKSKNKYFGLKDKIINAMLGIKYIDGNFSAAYSSVSDKMPSNYFEWKQLPVINQDQLLEYTQILNQFWNYNKESNLKGKIIFLEESFYVDGRGNRDLEIINDIMKYSYGREILVKLHPRTRDNRFRKLGLSVYENTSVPWELLALNGDLDDTILVCVGSGAILYPKLYWGIDQKSIALLNCEDYRFPYLDNDYYSIFSNVCTENQLAYMPKDRNEFIQILGELCDESQGSTEFN